MFLDEDKIEIFISVLSFIVFASGLLGIYLFINRISNPCRNPLFFYNSNMDNGGNSVKIDLRTVFFNFFTKRKKYTIIIFFLVLFVTLLVFFRNIMLAAFVAVMGSCIFVEIIDGIIRKRKEALDIQLIEFITNIIIMLKAGKEIRQIFKESLACIKKPLRNYLKIMVSEVELNISMDNALDNFALNIGGKEVVLLSNAIKINRKIGGNLLFILENIIKTLQENLKIRSNIKTQTAQSRFSGNFISLFPIAGFIFMYFSMNSSLKEFLLSKPGIILLAAGAILEFFGFFIIKKILREEQV